MFANGRGNQSISKEEIFSNFNGLAPRQIFLSLLPAKYCLQCLSLAYVCIHVYICFNLIGLSIFFLPWLPLL